MDFRPPAPWPFRPDGDPAAPHAMQLPASVRLIVDRTYWDNAAPIPADIAGQQIVQQNIGWINHIIRSQRLLYSLGIIPVLHNIRHLPNLIVDYMNQFGQEIITIIVSPSITTSPTGGVIVACGDPRDKDNATIAWFKEVATQGGGPQLLEYQNNVKFPVAPTLTGLLDPSTGDVIPPIPASAQFLFDAEDKWYASGFFWTQSISHPPAGFPPDSDNVYYSPSAKLLKQPPDKVPPDNVDILVKGVKLTFTSDSSTVKITINGTLVTLYTFDPTVYIAIDNADHVMVISGGNVTTFNQNTADVISRISLTPNPWVTLDGVQDLDGTSYIAETNGVGAPITKSYRLRRVDKNGNEVWSVQLSPVSILPVALARTDNLIAVMSSPVRPNDIPGTSPAWWYVMNNIFVGGDPLFWLQSNCQPQSSAADAEAAFTQSYPDLPDVHFVIVPATNDPQADAQTCRAILAQSVIANHDFLGQEGHTYVPIYGSDTTSSGVQYPPAKSSIFVFRKKDGTLVQKIPWATGKLVIYNSSEGDGVDFPGKLYGATSTPNY